VQGPSSNSQFFAEFAKPTGEYLDGFAEAVPSLTSTASQLMDNSQSTFHFYWSGVMPRAGTHSLGTSGAWTGGRAAPLYGTAAAGKRVRRFDRGGICTSMAMRVGYVDVLWQMRIGIKPLKPPCGNSHHVPAAAARAHPGYRTTMEACWRNCSEAAAGNDGQRDTCVSDSCFTAAQAEDRKACREPYNLENSASRVHAVAYCSR